MLSKEDKTQFTNFTSKHGKQYKSVEEFNEREQKWKEADDYIKMRNAQNEGKKNGLKLAHNIMSDLTDEEYMSMLGLTNDMEMKKNATTLDFDNADDVEFKTRKL